MKVHGRKVAAALTGVVSMASMMVLSFGSPASATTTADYTGGCSIAPECLPVPLLSTGAPVDYEEEAYIVCVGYEPTCSGQDDNFAGYYWNGSNWIEGSRGFRPYGQGNTALLLTNVAVNVYEQVASEYLGDDVNVIH
jgi:hypothetical protein